MLRAQLELGQVKQEIDRRIAEKEEEFNNTRWVLYLCSLVWGYIVLVESFEEIYMG